MRRTRFMSLFFLALSAAFFCVQDFRWALQFPLLEYFFLKGGQVALAPPGPSARQLEALRRRAEKNGDAQQLAFAAMHWPYDKREESFRLAEQAVARDPSLTWIYYHAASRHVGQWREAAVAERLRSWVAKLEAFDPDNALPSLFHAELLRAAAKDWPQRSHVANADKAVWWPFLLAQTEWRAAMEHAFQQPRFDEYSVRRFDLERTVLRQQGWENPSTMLRYVAGYTAPNLLNIRQFAEFQTEYVAAQAERAGRHNQALATCFRTAAFGRRLREGAANLMEGLIGTVVEAMGTRPWPEALRKAGRVEEATLAELQLSYLRRGAGVYARELLLQSSTSYWSGLLLHIFEFIVILFGLLTLASVLYVNAKRWVRPRVRGRLYQAVTVAENYLPILLFFGCLGVYLVYSPYAYNFRQYMATKAEIHQIEPFFYNIYPGAGLVPGYLTMPVERPFADYGYWALAALVVVALLAAYEERQVRKHAASGPVRAAGTGS